MALSSGNPLVSQGLDEDGLLEVRRCGDDPDSGEGSIEGSDEESDNGEDPILKSTLRADGLAGKLFETQTANELGLVRSEVSRLRVKVQRLEAEKDDMAEDFRNTTKILLNRIKDLTEELEGTQNRPQTAAVIERIEGAKSSRPPRPRGSPGGHSGRSRPHAPEVMRIEEEPPSPTAAGSGAGGGAAESAARGGGRTVSDTVSEEAGGGSATAGDGDTSFCGNCRRNIPAGNVLAHSVSCYRNNFRCQECDEVMPLRDKESHAQLWTDPVKLLEATAQRDVETLTKMFGHGADFSAVEHPETRETVMHAAARLDDVPLIEYFMGFGVDVDPVSAAGETPLHLAAESCAPGGEARSVKLLADLGAKLNLPNGRGETALMLVCRRGVARAAQYLLEQRADAEAQTRLGDTPLQIAQRNGHQETVLALCKAGAQLRPGTPSRARSGSPMPAPVIPSPPGTSGGYPGSRRETPPLPPTTRRFA